MLYLSAKSKFSFESGMQTFNGIQQNLIDPQVFKAIWIVSMAMNE